MKPLYWRVVKWHWNDENSVWWRKRLEIKQKQNKKIEKHGYLYRPACIWGPQDWLSSCALCSVVDGKRVMMMKCDVVWCLFYAFWCYLDSEKHCNGNHSHRERFPNSNVTFNTLFKVLTELSDIGWYIFTPIHIYFQCLCLFLCVTYSFLFPIYIINRVLLMIINRI